MTKGREAFAGRFRNWRLLRPKELLSTVNRSRRDNVQRATRRCGPRSLGVAGVVVSERQRHRCPITREVGTLLEGEGISHGYCRTYHLHGEKQPTATAYKVVRRQPIPVKIWETGHKLSEARCTYLRETCWIVALMR